MWPHVIQKMTSCARVHNWNQVMYTYMGVLIDASTTKCVNISNTKLPSANRWRLHVPNNTGPTHLIQKTRYTRFQNTTHQDAAYYFRTNGDNFEQSDHYKYACKWVFIMNAGWNLSRTKYIHSTNRMYRRLHMLSHVYVAHTHIPITAHTGTLTAWLQLQNSKPNAFRSYEISGVGENRFHKSFMRWVRIRICWKLTFTNSLFQLPNKWHHIWFNLWALLI